MNPHTGAPRHVRLTMILAVVVLVASGASYGQSALINGNVCGPLNPPGQYGPFDYRTISEEVRHRVEDYHFTQVVEQARSGVSGYYGGDVDYTLRAFPNNPRALLSIARYSMTHHTERVQGARYATECYFERAIRFTPGDPMVRLIYAIYLKDRNRAAEVATQLDQADSLRGTATNFDFDYNLGLLYFDIHSYDKALVAAKRAYALGAPFPALQKKLKAAGKWNDDPLPEAASGAPPAPAAAPTPTPTELAAPAPVVTEAPDQPH